MPTTQIISVFCEGPHDIAFLTKLLKAADYQSNDGSKINDYPTPINKLLLAEANKSNLQDLNLQTIKQTTLPLTSLKKDNNYLLFYALRGDQKRAERISYLRKIKKLLPTPNEIIRLPPNTKLSVLYFFDADEKGKTDRISSINAEIREVFDNLSASTRLTTENPINIDKHLSLGAYIFTQPNTETGKLEDLIEPLMREGNETIFSAAEQFINDHHDARRCTRNNFNRQKSIIGVSGQLQKSGVSNFDCIRQTDYLTKEKLLSHEECKKIIALFNALITTSTVN